MKARDKIQLSHTRDVKTLLAVEVDVGVTLEVFGEPDAASYEWRLVRDNGLVEQHSNVGYGVPAIALRDGLCAYIGPPEESGFNAVDLRAK